MQSRLSIISKYSEMSNAPLLLPALKLWEKTCDSILQREAILQRWQQWDQQHPSIPRYVYVRMMMQYLRCF